MEVPPTEFAVQGLELDWPGVCWGADLRHDGNVWTKWQFRGSNGQTVRDEGPRVFVSNRYRVMLTKAWEGFVIFIPNGDKEDLTRAPKYYDDSYKFILSYGAKPLLMN
jgi:DUF2075 family protein